MNFSGPIMTLLAGMVLAGGLLTANLEASPAQIESVDASQTPGEDSDSTEESAEGSAQDGDEEDSKDEDSEDSKNSRDKEKDKDSEEDEDSGKGSRKESDSDEKSGGRSRDRSDEEAESDQAAAPAQKAPATFAGRISGGGATVAISLRDGVAIAYVCDGKRVESWLKGSAANGRLELTGKGGARIEGTFDQRRAKGSIDVAGKDWTFTAPAVSKPSGAYRATAQVRGARVDAGWIVLPDGTQVGILTSGRTGATAAPRLDPVTGRAGLNGAVLVAAPAAPAVPAGQGR